MAKGKRPTVPVTKRALIQRINRVLAKRGEQMKKARGRRSYDALPFYVININRACIVAEYADPEKWGRDLEVLAPWEHVED